MSFTIEVNNKNVLDALNRLLQSSSDLSPLMHTIGDEVTRRAKDRFETSTAPDGTPWAPNRASTLNKLLYKNKKNFTTKGWGVSTGRKGADRKEAAYLRWVLVRKYIPQL